MLELSKKQLEELARNIAAKEITAPMTGDKQIIAKSRNSSGYTTGIIFSKNEKIYYATGTIASATTY